MVHRNHKLSTLVVHDCMRMKTISTPSHAMTPVTRLCGIYTVLIIKNALPYHPRHLMHMVDTVPAEGMWSVIGVGPAQLPASTMGIVMGGHCRVGLEDNLFYAYKQLATNAQLVERVVRLAKELQREVATPDEARAMLKIENS